MLPKLKSRWMGHIKPSITKRISADFEPFRADAENLKNEIFNSKHIEIVKYLKDKYSLSLCDAVDFSVAFIGVYNNGDNGWRTFNNNRYENGMKVRQRIVESQNV